MVTESLFAGDSKMAGCIAAKDHGAAVAAAVPIPNERRRSLREITMLLLIINNGHTANCLCVPSAIPSKFVEQVEGEITTNLRIV